MNAVAFCLYGNNPKYLDGMLQNAWLMPRIYPGWECHVWTDSDVPPAYITSLWRHGATIHPMERGWKQRMFYRFLIHDELGVDRYLVRDADSRISMRERRCVDEWMASGKILHTIHDHPYHIRPIQGGMFGVWSKQCSWRMLPTIGSYPSLDKWGQDEEFLSNVIWPMLSGSFIEHGRTRPIPYADGDDPGSFIGEIFNQFGEPEHPEHRTMRK